MKPNLSNTISCELLSEVQLVIMDWSNYAAIFMLLCVKLSWLHIEACPLTRLHRHLPETAKIHKTKTQKLRNIEDSLVFRNGISIIDKYKRHVMQFNCISVHNLPFRIKLSNDDVFPLRLPSRSEWRFASNSSGTADMQLSIRQVGSQLSFCGWSSLGYYGTTSWAITLSFIFVTRMRFFLRQVPSIEES